MRAAKERELTVAVDCAGTALRKLAHTRRVNMFAGGVDKDALSIDGGDSGGDGPALIGNGVNDGTMVELECGQR